HPADDKPPAGVVNPPGAPASPTGSPGRQVAGRSTSLPRETPAELRHVVAEGETLYGLAEQYYGDGQRFVELYRANRDVLKRPERLEVGTVLVIPNVPDTPASGGRKPPDTGE